jgi:hypothetical protein
MRSRLRLTRIVLLCKLFPLVKKQSFSYWPIRVMQAFSTFVIEYISGSFVYA